MAQLLRRDIEHCELASEVKCEAQAITLMLRTLAGTATALNAGNAAEPQVDVARSAMQHAVTSAVSLIRVHGELMCSAAGDCQKATTRALAIACTAVKAASDALGLEDICNEVCDGLQAAAPVIAQFFPDGVAMPARGFPTASEAASKNKKREQEEDVDDEEIVSDVDEFDCKCASNPNSKDEEFCPVHPNPRKRQRLQQDSATRPTPTRRRHNLRKKN